MAVIEVSGRWRPHLRCSAGRSRQGYHDITRYPDYGAFRDSCVPLGCSTVLRARNCFVSALDAVARSPTPARWLVVAASQVAASNHRSRLHLRAGRHATAAGIELCFAEMKDPVKDKLKRFGLYTRLGEKTFFATVGEAVSAYLAARPIEWIDWEDRPTS
jgi:hypothetical protein